MTRSRRDFIKTSAAIGLAGVSQASAQGKRAAASPPWIGLLHSTSVERFMEEAFIDGLKADGTNAWIGDPTAPLDAPNRVVVRRVHGIGKYGRDRTNDLNNAAQDVQQITPNPQLIVAAGGNVAALAVNSLMWSSGTQIPMLVAVGRSDAFESNSSIYGVNLEKTNPRQIMKDKLDNFLREQTKYNVANNQLCFLYNGNSRMAAAQLADWVALTDNADATKRGKQIDASDLQNTSTTVNLTADDSNKNSRINFKNAIEAAIALIGPDTSPRAIVVSSDPYFTANRSRIIRIVKRLTTRRQQPVKNLVMCYPFEEYDDEAQDAGFTYDDYMMSGPKLYDVYKTLGMKAAKILADKSTTFTPRFEEASRRTLAK